jgi:hypothetical protein
MQSSTQKIIIGVLAFAILVFIGYKTVFNSSGTATPAASDAASGDGQDSAGQDILTAVDKLNSVQIDGTLFASPLFSNLKDYSTPLTIDQQGRPNPFASIGGMDQTASDSSGAGSAVSGKTSSATKDGAAAASKTQGKSSEI